MKVVVLQSNYLPWKGYFDLIHDADLFIFYDEVKYTKNDWRNRNRIYTKNGLQWLTIPIPHGAVKQKISEVPLPAGDWPELHYKALAFGYGRAAFFSQLDELMRPVFMERRWSRLSELNQNLIREIARRLGIGTPIEDSARYQAVQGNDRVERLLDLLKEVGATHYISGPSAREYLAPHAHLFAESGIELQYKDYGGYRPYRQLREPFEPAVSILDLIANVDWASIPKHLWGSRGPA
jgi:hypothetical protein